VEYWADLAAAQQHLAQAERFEGVSHLRDSVRFFECRSQVNALLGKPQAALSDIVHAVEIASEAGEWHSVVRCWGNFADQMATLNERRLAFEAFERGYEVLHAQRVSGRNGAWFGLQYAGDCLLYGELERARALLDPVLAANIEMPRFALLLAAAGIALGLALEDDELVRRCARTELVDFASQTAGTTSLAAEAFTPYYLARGEDMVARSLLHRAVEEVRNSKSTTIGDEPLLVMVAQYGETTDIPAARTMLLAIVAKHRGRASRGFVQLFEAYVARREGDRAGAVARAIEAARVFRELQWPCYKAQALEVADRRAQALEIYRRIGDLRDARRLESALNPREQTRPAEDGAHGARDRGGATRCRRKVESGDRGGARHQ
jgi:tetratricopeptide (TPR) repeat protein